MTTRTTAILALALIIGGCTIITKTDTDFLPDPEAGPSDAGTTDCSPEGLVEHWDECHDGCDNDGDGATDCEDTDCAHYCCINPGSEYGNCNDQCDNDLDGQIDCDDSECTSIDICTPPPALEGICRGADTDPACCTETPPVPMSPRDWCCSNEEDDDLDGSTDCEDEDCAPSSLCCGLETPHVDAANGELDEAYWQPFGGGRGDIIWENDRIIDWNDDGIFGGAASREPADMAFGLGIRFHVTIVEAAQCSDPLLCPSSAGIALGPSSAPTSAVIPTWNLAVLATSSGHVVVLRGQRVLHRIGVPGLAEGVQPVPREVGVDLTPAADEDRQNGFRMVLRVEGGREVCHPDGSIIGCPEEPEWMSEDLVLLDEDNILDEGGRGTVLMALGTGSGVHFSDAADETIRVSVRSCANPSAWEHPQGDLDDRIGQDHLCWAAGAVGSPSVARASRTGYAMVLEGTTRDVSIAGYGTNHYSLGWIESSDPTFREWFPGPTEGEDLAHRFRPIDTDLDLNCMSSAPTTESCEDWGFTPLDPAPGRCLDARGRRSPHIISTGSGYLGVLYSQSIDRWGWSSKIATATYTPSSGTWSPRSGPTNELTPAAVSMSNPDGYEYRALRDPVALCRPYPEPDGTCSSGTFMVMFVGERIAPTDGDGDVDSDADGDADGGDRGDADLDADTTGDGDVDPDDEGPPPPPPSPASIHDDLLYVELNFADMEFDVSYFMVLDGGDPESPLYGRRIFEPWVLWDPVTEQYFLWVTTSKPPSTETQVDLLLGQYESTGSPDEHPLAGAVWSLWNGSPVMRPRDLELLWPDGHDNDIDCSGGCLIGGVTAIVVPNEEMGRDRLHMWVGVTEMPASDDPAVWHVRHLEQYFGLP